MSVAVSNTNIYIVGRGAAYDGPYLLPNVFFIKSDLSGNLTLSKNILSSEDITYREGYAGGLEFISDSILAYAGTFEKYDTLFPPWFSEHNGMIYFFNLLGDTISTKHFIGDGFLQFSRLFYDKERKRIYAGWGTRDTLIEPGLAYTVCLDSVGNLIWDQRLGNGVLTELTGLYDVFDNGNIVAGGIVTQEPDLQDGKFYKMDINGNAYFEKVVGTVGYDNEIELKVAKNQKSIIVRQRLDTVLVPGDYEKSVYIGKMDTNGVFIWRTFLNGAYYKYLYTTRAFDDGSIVAVGGEKVEGSAGVHGYIVKLDSNGAVLWERNYSEYPAYDHYLYDFQIMQDGGYVASGIGVDNIDGAPQSMCWLLRVDSMGCLVPGCDGTPIENNNLNLKAGFTIYPNPAHSSVTLELHVPNDLNILPEEKLTVALTDMQGRITTMNSNITIINVGETIRFQIQLDEISSAAYTVAILYGDNILGVQKLIKD